MFFNKKKSALPYKLNKTKTSKVFSIDYSKQPLSEANQSAVEKNDRFIAIGSTEKLPHGELRCFVQKDVAAVALFDSEKRIGEILFFRPESAEQLRDGSLLPESAFSMENSWFLGTAWSSQSGTSLWTVLGLRKDGKAEKELLSDTAA